ncbi:MAG: hypothetical protein H6811_07755 [Phycisphaeraceae bacterium]|nr:hypothetical protein [Phycisphaeraceae bacterium]
MSEPEFSDFGGARPRAVDERRSTRLGVASLIIGLTFPLTCLGSLLIAAATLEATSFRVAIFALLVPVAIGFVGVVLGSLGMFKVYRANGRLRGTAVCAGGIALNIAFLILSLVSLTGMTKLASESADTVRAALQGVGAGDADAVRGVLTTEAGAAMTDDVLGAFRAHLAEAMGEFRRGPDSLAELDRAARAIPGARAALKRSMKDHPTLPAIPMWFEKQRAVVLVRFSQGSFVSGGLVLRGSISDLGIVAEDGQEFWLMGDQPAAP